jgi:hypothetical protein
MALLAGQVAPVPIHTQRDVINFLPGDKGEREGVMAVLVGSFTQRSVQVQSTSSVLTETANGRSIPENVADLASLTTGRSRNPVADHKVVALEVPKEDNVVGARKVPKADSKVVGEDNMEGFRWVRVIRTPFFSY